MIKKTCKICRRLGFSVCGKEHCSLKRKPYPPGIHGKSFRRASSEYGLQLREKQKLRASYGLRESQFKNYVLRAIKQKSMNSVEAVFYFLESRLDNVVFRLGFAKTRALARQIVNHGHIMVNGKKISIPSFKTSVGDKISIRSQSGQKGVFKDLEITLKKQEVPPWLSLDIQNKIGTVLGRPVGDDLAGIYNVKAIVEYYSR